MKMRSIFLSSLFFLALFVSGSAGLPGDARPDQPDLTVTPSNGLSTEFDTPDLLGCPASLVYGDLIQCAITTAAENDIFTFQGSNQERVYIRVVETSGTLYAYQEIIRPDGSTLCGPTTSDGLNCVLDTSGTYKIIVRDYYGTRTGEYSLYLQRLNDPVGCSALEYGSLPVTGSISLAAEHDCFTIPGAVNELIHIRVSESSGTLYAYQEVLRPDGTTLCGPTTSDTLECTLDGSGDYILLLRDYYGNRSGDYGISMQRLNDPVGCSPLAYIPPPVSGSINLPAEYDCFSFAGVANRPIRIRAIETSGTLYAYQEILRPDGTTLCGPTTGDEMGCVLDGSGPFTLLLRDYYGTRSGNYNVDLQRLNNPPGCGSLTYDAPPVSGTIDLAAEYDCFSFSGGANAQVRSKVIETSGTLYAYQEILRPDGTTLYGPTTNNEISFTLDISGIYTLLLRDYYGSRTGNYNVSLLCLSGDCGGPPTPTPTASPTPTPTKTPGPSPTPTPTRTPPPGGYKHQFLSLVKLGSEYFEGPWEQEDNDSYLQANGPLRSARDYYGYPDDQKDFFSLSMLKAGKVTVDLTNHTGHGVQIQMFYQSVDNRVCFDPSAPYHCEYDGQAGRYYIYIYTESGFNNINPYTLRATYPDK